MEQFYRGSRRPMNYSVMFWRVFNPVWLTRITLVPNSARSVTHFRPDPPIKASTVRSARKPFNLNHSRARIHTAVNSTIEKRPKIVHSFSNNFTLSSTRKQLTRKYRKEQSSKRKIRIERNSEQTFSNNSPDLPDNHDRVESAESAHNHGK